MIQFPPIPVEHCVSSRLAEVDFNQLEFGKYMSDHMLVCHYSGKEWKTPAIVPYGPITMQPTALALHYGQSVFEGMKAFKLADGRASIFRIRKHWDRLQRTLTRMCMPPVPFDLFEEGLKQLIALDRNWIPSDEGSSLYIRPLVFATEDRFGVKVSDEYMFIIMTGPVPPFYPRPLRVKVEDTYSRACKGGTGAAKCAGNYGGAFYATQLAREQGFDQVLWTDLSPELHIEESGTMNVFFVIGDKVVTPPLSETILEGVTRDSVLTLCGKLGIEVEQRPIPAMELLRAHRDGTLREAFGTGTAAVTAPICAIGVREATIELPDYSEDAVCKRLFRAMSDIQRGKAPDTEGWLTTV